METKGNHYPVLILDTETVVGTARWGKNGRDNAKEQALNMAHSARARGFEVYQTKIVRASSRQEVKDLYAGIRFENLSRR